MVENCLWALQRIYCTLTWCPPIFQLLAFIRIYTLLNDSNKVIVYGIGSASSHLIYSSHHALCSSPSSTDPIYDIAQNIEQALIEEKSLQTPKGSSVFTCALSKAICLLHKLCRTEDKVNTCKPRILCLTASDDVPSQYIAVMNCIFAAQRQNVVIDGCKLGPSHSTYLQQASYMTGGVYQRLSRPAAFLQTMTSLFAVDLYSRGFLRLPATSEVDFRASCFCHRNSLDMGYVCSVCLSVYCSQVPECGTCGTCFN